MRQLLKTHGDTPIFLQSPDESLDDVALLVGILVEGRIWSRPVAHVSSLLSVAGDDAFDSPISTPPVDALVLVGVVSGDGLDSAPLSPPPSSSALLDDVLEKEGIVALSWAGGEAERGASAVADQMELGGQSSARSAKIMVIWFLRSPFFPAPLAAR